MPRVRQMKTGTTRTSKSVARRVPLAARPHRKLSEVAKHLVLPSDIATTGYPAVAAQCAKMGVEHDDWQQGLGRAMLAKRTNGLYAAGIGGVIISICRQVGKTFTIGTIVFALCILFPGIKVLWTAHHAATSDETFDTLAALARRQRIAPYIRQVRGGNGKQRIVFTNGSRIMFGAREHGFGRGIPGVSIVVFDEAQILKAKALDDMVPAANTVKNPLIIYMGTPPKPTDPAEVFKARRQKALKVKERRATGETVAWNTLYLEVGADVGADPNDSKARAKANPSYPHRTPDEAIERMRENLVDEESFLREGMGIWDEDTDGTGVIDLAKWRAHHVKKLRVIKSSVVLAADTSVDRKLSALVAIGAGSDGIPQARLVLSAAGSVWMPDLVVRVCRDHPEVAAIVIDQKKSTEPMAEAIETALDEAGIDIEIIRTSYPDMAEACAITFDLIHEGKMRHLGDADLDAAVRTAVKSESEGAFTWSRRRAGAAIVPLVAITIGIWDWLRREATSYDVMDSIG
jgi:phage terminase large subunit-like protein